MGSTTGRSARIAYAEIPITGLTCAGEAITAERALATLVGIERVVVNPVTEIVYVWYHPDQCTMHAVRSAVERAGYRPR
jgi:copper chaperone CopZ